MRCAEKNMQLRKKSLTNEIKCVSFKAELSSSTQSGFSVFAMRNENRMVWMNNSLM